MVAQSALLADVSFFTLPFFFFWRRTCQCSNRRSAGTSRSRRRGTQTSPLSTANGGWAQQTCRISPSGAPCTFQRNVHVAEILNSMAPAMTYLADNNTANPRGTPELAQQGAAWGARPKKHSRLSGKRENGAANDGAVIFFFRDPQTPWSP